MRVSSVEPAARVSKALISISSPFAQRSLLLIGCFESLVTAVLGNRPSLKGDPLSVTGTSNGLTTLNAIRRARTSLSSASLVGSVAEAEPILLSGVDFDAALLSGKVGSISTGSFSLGSPGGGTVSAISTYIVSVETCVTKICGSTPYTFTAGATTCVFAGASFASSSASRRFACSSFVSR